MNNSQNEHPINYTTIIDPYIVETLKTIIGRSVLIETVRGSLQGMLVEVKPDHIVVKTYGTETVFYIRLQQIIYVMPI
ncbi:DUF2642 domain-containing protein [Clostridium lacusfryxellense]|uniref:DUF2642 domain-containing protein n=1 Tax=Clostridium lacusfryxellense TaxID=205328 RepID=UPI001C0DB0EC|nr:DUF2642 domain-containing protein [Clostridium lacusfryxellense]MBU3112689.1 YuzF family protein [Clostridium lacusfryxellense]